MGARGKITVEDIADHFHLSKATVSRALTGRGRISDKTTQMIRQYAEENGYRKPGADRKLKKEAGDSASGNIAVIVPNDMLRESGFFSQCLLGIAESAAQSDYDVITVVTNLYGGDRLQNILDKGKVDGVILLRILENDRNVAILRRYKVPFVEIGSSGQDTYQVDVNSRLAVRELTAHLLISGYHRLVFLGGRESIEVDLQRYEGFREAVMSYQGTLNQSLYYRNVITPEACRQALENILMNKMDAVVCCDDVQCHQVLDILTMKGVSVPDELAVASCYNNVYLDNHTPPVTAIDIDSHEEGVIAGKVMINVLKGTQKEKKIPIPYNIQLRQSTRSRMR